MRASEAPVTGAPATGIVTGSSSSFGVGTCPQREDSAEVTASGTLFPALMAAIKAAESPLLYEQPGSLTRHSATFMSQPHGQPCSRSTFSTASLRAAVRPVKSTYGRLVWVFYSCCATSTAASERQSVANRGLREMRFMVLIPVYDGRAGVWRNQFSWGGLLFPSEAGAIEQETDMVQYVAAKNPNLVISKEELPPVGFSQQHKLRSDGSGHARCSIKRNQLIACARESKSKRVNGGLGQQGDVSARIDQHWQVGFILARLWISEGDTDR